MRLCRGWWRGTGPGTGR
ncbi:hypothetical protein Ahy_A01g003563 isoform D [Arachis hypogaea]|uniref:Uncharacterized protein n=1 Tax=Arachis hypogaea TaxID=3818 RepID=A0A445ETM8_ARAHY|nr:hypothetical protein Ahy_A01g003563 isoform D [Arachis hypogaea]